jgi:carboxylesterase type B
LLALNNIKSKVRRDSMEPVTETILQLRGHGSLRGLQFGTSVRRFVNIAYAKPPLGALRWEKPVGLPSDHIYGVHGRPQDCTKFGPICPQPDYVVDGVSYSAVDGSKVWISLHNDDYKNILH